MSEEGAEDLVQDVFTTFLATLDRFEGKSQLRTWLFGILHNKIRERRREAWRDEQQDPIDGVFESHFDTRGNWIRPPEDVLASLESKKIGTGENADDPMPLHLAMCRHCSRFAEQLKRPGAAGRRRSAETDADGGLEDRLLRCLADRTGESS